MALQAVSLQLATSKIVNPFSGAQEVFGAAQKSNNVQKVHFPKVRASNEQKGDGQPLKQTRRSAMLAYTAALAAGQIVGAPAYAKIAQIKRGGGPDLQGLQGDAEGLANNIGGKLDGLGSKAEGNLGGLGDKAQGFAQRKLGGNDVASQAQGALKEGLGNAKKGFGNLQGDAQGSVGSSLGEATGKAKGAFGRVQNQASKAGDVAQGKSGGLFNKAGNAADDVADNAKGLFGKAQNQASKAGDVAQGNSGILGQVQNAAEDVADNAKGLFGQAKGQASNAADVAQGKSSGLFGQGNNAADNAKNSIQDAVDSAKNRTGLFSSNFDEAGRTVIKGSGVAPQRAGEDVAAGIKDAGKEAAGSLKGLQGQYAQTVNEAKDNVGTVSSSFDSTGKALTEGPKNVADSLKGVFGGPADKAQNAASNVADQAGSKADGLFSSIGNQIQKGLDQ
eukprot:jgi/Mesen1/8508/ME000480S07854